MEWKNAAQIQHQNETLYDIPGRWIHLHHYEALNILFRIENSLRIFVYTVLKNENLDQWSSVQISVATGGKESIGNIAKKRVSQSSKCGYIGYPISCPVMHLTSGELIVVITGPWECFSRFFRETGAKEIILNKLEEIATIRNALAHFRPIKPEDVELIKQNARHVLSAVDECLAELTNASQRVPTNTDTNWYKELASIGSEEFPVLLFQGRSEDWIRVELSYSSRILHQQLYGQTFCSYKLTKLVTPHVVADYPEIRKRVTYISEFVPGADMPPDMKPIVRKKLSFVFSKRRLAEATGELRDTFVGLIEEIRKQEQLVSDDHLARGSLIEPVDTSALNRQNEPHQGWKLDTTPLNCPISGGHSTEYWGSFMLWGSNFIAASHTFPWMPQDVSRFDLW